MSIEQDQNIFENRDRKNEKAYDKSFSNKSAPTRSSFIDSFDSKAPYGGDAEGSEMKNLGDFAINGNQSSLEKEYGSLQGGRNIRVSISQFFRIADIRQPNYTFEEKVNPTAPRLVSRRGLGHP